MNHKLHLSITVHHVCGNNFVTPDLSQILLCSILFRIRNIHFQCHVISNYFVVNITLCIDFDQTVITDTTVT